jgi:hypothetical protein
MPSNKTLTIFILCLGVVISVWFVTNKQKRLSQNTVSKKDGVVAQDPIAIKNTDYDWKKILTDSNKANSKVIDLTKTVNLSEGDNTLTDQMSRDILSQYLIVAKNGDGLTPDMASQIVNNTLSLPDYKPSFVTYIKENLKIVKKDDPVTFETYSQKINQALMPVYYEVKVDPIAILMTSLQSDNETELKKLDPLIVINKKAIKTLVEMEVPESAAGIHLYLLNTSSKILSNLEAIRVAVSDPVKIFTVIGDYSQNMSEFGKTVTSLNALLKQKTIINIR